MSHDIDAVFDHTEDGPDPGTPPGSRASVPVAVGLAVLLLVGLVLAVWQWRVHAERTAEQDAREEATAAATQFALRMDNFKGTDLAGYQERVNQVLTTRAKAQFKESFPAFQQVYRQGKAVGVGKVRVAGVQDIDPDSATVLVVHDRLVKSSYGDQQQYLRWSVELSKVDDRWLVNKFSDGQ